MSDDDRVSLQSLLFATPSSRGKGAWAAWHTQQPAWLLGQRAMWRCSTALACGRGRQRCFAACTPAPRGMACPCRRQRDAALAGQVCLAAAAPQQRGWRAAGGDAHAGAHAEHAALLHGHQPGKPYWQEESGWHRRQVLCLALSTLRLPRHHPCHHLVLTCYSLKHPSPLLRRMRTSKRRHALRCALGPAPPSTSSHRRPASPVSCWLCCGVAELGRV